MKIGILGSGAVAKTLGAGFLAHGHAVALGTRDPDKLEDWAQAHPAAQVLDVAAAAAFGELIVLAVKGAAAAAVLRLAGASTLAGKPVIDATNPIDERTPPQHGVLSFFTTLDGSLMEQLQREFPDARFVKAFNSVGNARMVNPQYRQGPPTMFICGDDAQAKTIVGGVLDQFGWEVADLGGVEAARAIEPLCILWCLPGFLGGGWTHAFKLLKDA